MTQSGLGGWELTRDSKWVGGWELTSDSKWVGGDGS